ncbi:hypothetical protein [Sphingomonas bacterium]|uniref:hypothetical protein n=1 Tax=Sphingomonas bacterium TaxID=1895847 RepID=UPI0020C61CC2|nr:hypothetical protein [Sphingomonas bacterium]
MTDYMSAQELPTNGVFNGIIDGDARVKRGSDLDVKGIINGDLFVEAESRVRVSGIVNGRVISDGADVELKGIIGG